MDNGQRTEAKEENLFLLEFQECLLGSLFLVWMPSFHFPQTNDMIQSVLTALVTVFLAAFVSSDLPEGKPGSSSSGFACLVLLNQQLMRRAKNDDSSCSLIEKLFTSISALRTERHISVSVAI